MTPEAKARFYKNLYRAKCEQYDALCKEVDDLLDELPAGQSSGTEPGAGGLVKGPPADASGGRTGESVPGRCPTTMRYLNGDGTEYRCDHAAGHLGPHHDVLRNMSWPQLIPTAGRRS